MAPFATHTQTLQMERMSGLARHSVLIPAAQTDRGKCARCLFQGLACQYEMIYLGFTFTRGTGGDTYRLCEVCRQCYEANKYPCLSDRFPQGCHNGRVLVPEPPPNAYEVVDIPDSDLWCIDSSKVEEDYEEEVEEEEEEVAGGLLQQDMEQQEINSEGVDEMSDEN
ncbi:hypothetical protein F5887DRAFT_1072903 [Amanita rubescens]|nr:hypothetical protein F5887DRAFT_1072903 [Amanita rubescens]